MHAGDVVSFGDRRVVATRLGLGTAWLGNMYAPVPAAQATAIVRHALQLGVRLIDTAPLYGYGMSEHRLGAALAGIARDSFVISTKVGRPLRPRRADDPVLSNYTGNGPLFVDAPDLHADFDFSADTTRRLITESLARLKLDRLDLALIHDPDDHFAQAVDGAYPALAELKHDRVIDAVGVGMNQARMLTRFVHTIDLDVVLLAGEYTLLDQTGLDELLPACQERGVAVVLGGVYNTGLLANPVPDACYKYQVAPAAVLTRAQQIRDVCARHGVPLRAAALQFPFGHPAMTSVLVGTRSVDELADNATMLSWPIPTDLWTDLRTEGLLPDHVPTPGPA
jgi:D-threo-aldose 1-dehydrogenase